MQIREVMTKRVETVPPGASAENALRRMRAGGIHHLVVPLDAGAVGVISTRDLESLASDRAYCTVADVMSAPAVTVDPRGTIREAANLLRGRTISCLPVLEDGKLVGILTTTDLLDLIGRGPRGEAGAAG